MKRLKAIFSASCYLGVIIFGGLVIDLMVCAIYLGVCFVITYLANDHGYFYFLSMLVIGVFLLALIPAMLASMVIWTDTFEWYQKKARGTGFPLDEKDGKISSLKE